MGTRYAEVIGDPISHTRSPLIHNHWLAYSAQDAEYRATKVTSAGLAEFLENRRSDRDWLGCNVTIPHKESALLLTDEVSQDAASIGAVNCIVPRAERLVGFNTDVDGIAAALDPVALEQARVAIIGAGGAARAALAYLQKRRPASIIVLARDVERAKELKALGMSPTLDLGRLDDAPTLLRDADLIINASPLGMRGCPQMPTQLLEAVTSAKGATLFDMVYDPIVTPFLAVGRLERIDGLTMLLGQARRAFELLFGVPAPPDDPMLRNRLLSSLTSSS